MRQRAAPTQPRRNRETHISLTRRRCTDGGSAHEARGQGSERRPAGEPRRKATLRSARRLQEGRRSPLAFCGRTITNCHRFSSPGPCTCGSSPHSRPRCRTVLTLVGYGHRKKLGVTRETINRWRGRSTQVWRWVHDHTGRRALELKPLVDRRVTELAISGSPEHTKLGPPVRREDGRAVRDEPGAGRIVVNNNFLVPRPDYAAAAGLPPAQTPAAAPATRPAIPRVSVRGPVSPP